MTEKNLLDRLRKYASFLNQNLREQEEAAGEESLQGSVAANQRWQSYRAAQKELVEQFPELHQEKPASDNTPLKLHLVKYTLGPISGGLSDATVVAAINEQEAENVVRSDLEHRLNTRNIGYILATEFGLYGYNILLIPKL